MMSGVFGDREEKHPQPLTAQPRKARPRASINESPQSHFGVERPAELREWAHGIRRRIEISTRTAWPGDVRLFGAGIGGPGPGVSGTDGPQLRSHLVVQYPGPACLPY